MMSINVDSRDRALPLDGLRGAAALAVVGFHLDLPMVRGGAVGVDWFFVLSAFLVTSLLLAQQNRDGPSTPCASSGGVDAD